MIRDQIQSRFAGHSRVDTRILSMGMSGDYKIAIQEGSTMIRVGSAIFKEVMQNLPAGRQVSIPGDSKI